MRGVKIGAKKGNKDIFSMGVFEMKDKKKEAEAAATQKAAEEIVKSSLTDKELGI